MQLATALVIVALLCCVQCDDANDAAAAANTVNNDAFSTVRFEVELRSDAFVERANGLSMLWTCLGGSGGATLLSEQIALRRSWITERDVGDVIARDAYAPGTASFDALGISFEQPLNSDPRTTTPSLERGAGVLVVTVYNATSLKTG